jgi:hypothetical protein
MERHRMKYLLIIGFFVSILASQKIFAQEVNKNNPTLEETFDFLKGKINGSKAIVNEPHQKDWKVGSQTYSFKVTRAENKFLFLEETYFRKLTFFLSSNTIVKTINCSIKVRLYLNEIIPDSIKVSEWENNFFVSMRSSDNFFFDKNCTTNGLSDESGVSHNDKYEIVFSTKETAEKVAKALKHAVKLNGGKEELF